MIKLITFTDANMTIAAEICKESALRNNVDQAQIFTYDGLHDAFKNKYADILAHPRGCGYWLWKPYIIGNEVLNASDGDIIIYADAGIEFIDNVRYITDRMRGDIFLFGNMYQHLHWCKMDVINGLCSGKKINFDKQVQASVIIVRVSDYSKKFINNWFKACTKPGYIDDSESSAKNHPQFREHRHDQAILTCLAYNEKIDLHWWPAIYNAGMFTYDHSGYEDRYPAVFHHHRFRNTEFLNYTGIAHQINNYFRQKKYKILCTVR